GVWSSLVCGFAGLRTDAGRIEFDPRLPELWEGLSFKLRLGESLLVVDLKPSQMVFVVESGDGADVVVKGREYYIEPGQPLSVPLPDQGPRLLGTPTTRDITGAQRADGSIITASVPVAAEQLTDSDTTDPN
ncbi:MAG: glycoside hydrolase family 65 protein, partial [Micrococcales bacterium]|nr:glycoside hydrolase family 65 protein [Micrococcales bacterium]